MDEWTFECPMEISVRPMDEWTYECPVDISVCPMDECTFECPMDISVRQMDEWTFLFAQWTNGHLFMSNNGHVTFTMPR